MIVCHCLAQSDRQITAAVAAGAATLAEVIACTGAGSACGGCLPLVALLADKELRLRAEARATKAALGQHTSACKGANACRNADTDAGADPVGAAAIVRPS